MPSQHFREQVLFVLYMGRCAEQMLLTICHHDHCSALTMGQSCAATSMEAAHS